MAICSLNRSISIIFSFSILLFSTISFSRTPEEIAAAREFTVENIGFSNTISLLKSKYPDAQIVQEESDSACNLVFYRIDSTNSTDGLDISFYKGKILELRAWYFPERVHGSFGSWDVIAEKLVSKIGKAEDVKQGKGEDDIAEITWRIPEAKRYFRLEVTTKRVLLQIVNTDLLKQYKDLKKLKGNAGF